MRYEVWQLGPRGWSHHKRDIYRWRWLARLVARWRRSRMFDYEVREAP
jgi:hypothetical protein